MSPFRAATLAPLLLAAACAAATPGPRDARHPPPAPCPVCPDPVPAACAARDAAIAAAYRPYRRAFVNVGYAVSPDGETLLFASDRGGRSLQLYLAPAGRPAARPAPVAPAPDPVSGARFTPDGRFILFTRDRGKDENTQIYRANRGGGDVTALTAAPARFHRLPRVTAGGRTLVYLRGDHKSGKLELVTQPLAGGAARPVASFEGYVFLTDVSADGKRALIFELSSMSVATVFEVDLGTGAARAMAPRKPGKALAHGARYGPEPGTFYVITDEGQARAYLALVDARTGEVRATYADAGAEAAAIRVCRGAGAVVLELDAGSHEGLELLDARTLKPRADVELPLGSVRLGDCTAAGAVVTLSTPGHPHDPHLLDPASGRLRPLRRDRRPGLARLGAMDVTVKRIPSFDTLTVPVNVYRPRRPRAARLPVVVRLHGGPASSYPVRWSDLGAFLVSRGFAVVEPNVRGSMGFGRAYEQADDGRRRMDSVRDVAAVNRWVRAQPWADPERIVVMGGSYGGYLTYMAVGHQPELWAAGVAMMGIVDIPAFLETTGGAIRRVLRDEFGRLPEDRDFLRSVSPVAVLDRMRAPLFVYQGQNDPRVPRSEQDALVRALRGRGVPVEYMVAPDEGHSLSRPYNRDAFVARSVRFLEQHLGLPGPDDACRAAGGSPAGGGAGGHTAGR